jgi:hypothetical protein
MLPGFELRLQVVPGVVHTTGQATSERFEKEITYYFETFQFIGTVDTFLQEVK